MLEKLNNKSDHTDLDKDKPLIHLVQIDELDTPTAITLCGKVLSRPPIPRSKMKDHKHCQPCLDLFELDNSLEA